MGRLGTDHDWRLGPIVDLSGTQEAICMRCANATSLPWNTGLPSYDPDNDWPFIEDRLGRMINPEDPCVQ